jgi:glycerol-3-phosphate dehydrogenase subunit B
MTDDADVVVVGGGMAGCMAALAAARTDSSATVHLVSASESTFRAASGLIDVLGYTPDGEGPLRDPFEAIPDLPPEHPYSTVGVPAVRDGLAVFDEATGDVYEGDHTDLNALVPTAGGATKPTARYPRWVTAGLAARTDEMLIVGFDRLTAMDAHLVADQLEASGVPFGTMGIDARFPMEITEYPAGPRMAAALDENETVTAADYMGQEETIPVREALADAIYGYHGFQERVGLPAVLGTTAHEETRAAIADRLGAEVFEIPLGPPSILGQRLESVLFDALARQGVALDTGTPIVDVHAEDGHVERLEVERDDGTTAIQADAFVLATGGVAGGGIRTDRRTVREPLFDCHVDAPSDRDDWFEDEFFGDHAFPRFGVSTDGAMRPLDGDGDPEYVNLYAAGSVIGGYDFAAEKSGSGVSIATGYVAGTRAAESR